MYTINRRFEWDDAKAYSNRLKHGLSFDEAVTAFNDEQAVEREDVKHSTLLERRYMLVGEMDPHVPALKHRILSIVFTHTDDVFRIISARPASRRERKLYAKKQTAFEHQGRS